MKALKIALSYQSGTRLKSKQSLKLYSIKIQPKLCKLLWKAV